MFRRLLILYILYLSISLYWKKHSLSTQNQLSQDKLFLKRTTIFSQFCQDTTDYFMTLTNGIEEEQIIDLFGVVEHNTLIIEGFINVWHLKDCSNHTHVNYTLVYQGKQYFNSRPFIPQAQHNHIRFVIHEKQSLWNSVIRVDLINNHLKHVYPGIKVCVRAVPPVKQNMAVCVYAAKQNSINEMRNWFAFFLMLRVDHIIVYVTDVNPSFYTEFKHIIENGFLILKQFNWPRNGIHGLIIHSNQEVQVNHCFYFYRYQFKSILFCDFDEFVFSEKYPFDLFSATHIYRNKNMSSIQIPSQYASDKDGDEKNREEVLGNGTQFDVYPYRYTFKETRREKLIIFDIFDGLVRIHDTIQSRLNAYADPIYLRIAHFRRGLRNGKPSLYSNHSYYTQQLRKTIQKIHSPVC